MPVVHETAFVDVSAQVIGDVAIGQESSIWMNAVVRGDVHSIRIGRRTNIQDGTIVHVMRETHPTIIHDEVTIGHGAIVHGCTIFRSGPRRHGRDPAQRRRDRLRLDRGGRHAADRRHDDRATIAGDGKPGQDPPSR